MDRGGRGMGGGGSETLRTVVYTDTVLANDEGSPTKVSRAFDTAEGSMTFGSGERAGERELESPLEGETLILELDEEGDVVAKMEDGSDPESSAMLEGHYLTLPLDAFLPEDAEVSSGDKWEPTGDDLKRVMLTDIEQALFPRPQMEEGGREGREGRGGRRGGMGRGGGSGLSFMRDAEWDATITYTDRTEDVDGVECVVLEVEFEAEGDLPERGFGRGGDRELSLAPFDAAGALVESTFEVTLEGTLCFSLEERRPVKLELEGEFTLDTITDRDTERGNFHMERTVEGTIEHTVTVESE